MVETQRTRQYLLDSVFQDGQAVNSITARDIRDFIVSMESIQGNFWEFYLDSVYHTTNRKTILAGVWTDIECDGLADNQFRPSNRTNTVWDVATNKLTPDALGDFYQIRFSISGASAAASENHIHIEIDVGGTAGKIYEDTKLFAHGTDDQEFNFSMGLFAGSDFLANGGIVRIKPEKDASFWDIAFTINRTYTVPA